ncbi:MAG: RagB/SusD family nutrient uptake outer membrane protein, partial [Muribaculaceae bacterium]|nr:RagB/SusD family nutrient uptake outer membrane protein [Muribaculaceae bacterium]
MMKNPWAFGYYYMLDQCSDLVTCTTTVYGAAARGESAAFASNNTSIQNHWQYLYELIHRANTVIRNVGGMENISTTTKNQIVGEGKFLRAMAYFELINCWGDVPYYGDDFVVAESYLKSDRPRESKDAIRERIIDDLNDAATKLPVKWDDANYGRATKGAAVALRGKVNLYNKQWQNAINDFEDIVYNKTENYGYELAKNIEEWEFMFHMYPGRRSAEYIFSMMSENAPGVGAYGNTLCTMLGSKATYLNIAGNPVVPSTRLIDKYENLDGTRFEWTDIFPNWESSYD